MIQSWLLLASVHLINVKYLFFLTLVGKVHPYALNKIHEKLRKLSHPFSQCSGIFLSAQGLPFAHDLLSICQQHVHIPLQSIHGHWHLDRLFTEIPLLEQPDTEIILDPVLVQPRGRPQRALNRRMGPAQVSQERSQFRAAQGQKCRSGNTQKQWSRSK